MKFKTKDELKESVKTTLENAEDKSGAIVECVDQIVTFNNQQLIDQIVAESAKAEQDAEFKKKLGLRNLSEEETKFYELLKDAKQSITANQVDIIPTTIIDRTLDDVRKEYPIMKLINFAPAGVKRWITASYTGSAVWGELFASLENDTEIAATIASMDLEVNKLRAILFIPKAIRDLALPYVDKYFSAILEEVLKDGIVEGYLNGDGKTAPIGITKKISEVNVNGTHKNKTVIDTLTGFSPKQLAPIRKTLSNNGKRVVGQLYLICNPADEADYVDPALYGEALVGGYKEVSFIHIEKIVEPKMTQGKAVFTMEKVYTMGLSALKIDDYKETKAVEDVDTIIAKAYGNGRANDDNCAVVIDVTQLEEYVLPVNQVTVPVTEEAEDEGEGEQ